MIMDDFKNVKGKLDVDYPRPKVPKKLKKVKLDGKRKIRLKPSNYWEILKAVFRNEALNQLQNKPSLFEKALAIRYIGLFTLGIIGLLMIVSLFR